VLETLRQPIETGEVIVARANAHIRYPCRFLLLAAANPCRCGHLYDADQACGRAPVCGEEYLARISGPLMDRFDLRLEVPPVSYRDLEMPRGARPPPPSRPGRRCARGRLRPLRELGSEARVNADAEGALLDRSRPRCRGERPCS
jgi:magnesium chelatase family protein